MFADRERVCGGEAKQKKKKPASVRKKNMNAPTKKKVGESFFYKSTNKKKERKKEKSQFVVIIFFSVLFSSVRVRLFQIKSSRRGNRDRPRVVSTHALKRKTQLASIGRVT